MAKITYEDKEFLNKNENIADKNKVNDTDLNEIKEVVNENDDNIGNLSDLNTTDKSNLVNAINETKNKSAITVMASANKQYAQNNYLVVDAYDNIINQLSNNIEMTSNGQFKVNKDINLLFSFYNNVQPWVTGGQSIMYKISINNEEPYMQQTYECDNQWGNSGQCVSNFLLKLKKDDTVALKLWSNNAKCAIRSGSFISLVEI